MTARYNLMGKTVLITGGGYGLGRELAEQAAASGAHVMIWDISLEAGEAVTQALRDRGFSACFATVDVSDRYAVAAAAQRVGEVDVLINNAGVITGRGILEGSEETIMRTFDVNTLALYWTTRAFLPGMIRRGHGAVVTIASTAGLVGVPRQTDYSASKFAALGFAESLRAELTRGRTGVNSLVVCPSYLNTTMASGVSLRFPRLLPRLSVQKVAQKVLRGVEKGSAQLVMPPLARAIPVARAMHVRQFDAMMRFFGLSSAMDNFHRRPLD